MTAFSKQVAAADAVSSAQAYMIGAGYSGYASRVRLAGHALTQIEIGENTAVNKIDKSNLEFFIDFTNSKPKDAGKHGLSLVCKHLCETRNIAEVFLFGAKGVISVLQSPPIAQNFSIIAKIYIPPEAVNDSTLLYYNTAKEKLALGIKDGSLTCSISEQDLAATSKLTLQQWIDVAVTLSGASLVLYVDGRRLRKARSACHFRV